MILTRKLNYNDARWPAATLVFSSRDNLKVALKFLRKQEGLKGNIVKELGDTWHIQKKPDILLRDVGFMLVTWVLAACIIIAQEADRKGLTLKEYAQHYAERHKP